MISPEDSYEENEYINQNQVFYSYLIDENCEYTAENLPYDKLTPVRKSFNPGFYKGVVWLDVIFPCIEKFDYSVFLGSEPLEYAELYIKTSSGWQFAGRTGQRVLSKYITDPDWFLSIPFHQSDFPNHGGFYHGRIKLLSHTASTNMVKILQKRTYDIHTAIINYINWGLITFYVICIFYFIFTGIHFNDSVYTHMACAVFSMLIFLLELKGIGPTILWNKLVSFPSSYRMIFVWAEITMLFLALIFIQIIKENHEKKYVVKDLSIAFAIIFLMFTVSAFLKDQTHVYYSLIGNLIATTILFTVMLIIYTIHNNTTMRLLFYFWIPAGIIVFTRTMLHLLRIRFFIPVFTFTDNDFYFIYDLVFVLIIIPFIILSSNRLREKYQQQQYSLHAEEKTNRYLISEISFYSSVNKKIMNLSNVIVNTLHLPQNQDPEYEKENQMLIERTASHIADILSVISLMENRQSISPSTINIQSFIYGLYKIAEKDAASKDINLSLTINIPTDVTVYENPRLLEMLIVKLMGIAIKYSPRNSKLKMDAELQGGELSITVKNKTYDIPSDRFILNDDELSDMLDYQLIERALKLFNGKITKETNLRGMKYIMTMPIHITDIKNGVIISDPLFTVSPKEKSNFKSDISVKDSLLLVEGKMPVILLIEDSINATVLFQQILKPHSHLYTSSSAIDAWNFLNMNNMIFPDVIICEYSLQGMNGMEFYRRCSESPAFGNIPFMMILSDEEKNKRDDFIRKGISSCITKPFNREYFLSVLLAILTTTSKAQAKVLSQISNAVQGRSDLGGNLQVNQKKVDYPSAASERKVPQQITLSTAEASAFAAYDLSKREQQIALLILEGKSDKEIAASLNISAATVATHNKKLFKKLEVHSRIELMNKLR